MNHSATPKAILTKVHHCTCNLNVYIFYLRFALGIIHGDRFVTGKHNKQLFYSSKPPFLFVEISNTVTV